MLLRACASRRMKNSSGDPLSFRPCHMTQVDLSQTALITNVFNKKGKKKASKLDFYYQKLVIKATEKPLYTFLEMVGESGGYVGILLGFSILDLLLMFSRRMEILYDTVLEDMKLKYIPKF